MNIFKFKSKTEDDLEEPPPKIYYDPLFKMLPALRFLSFSCIDTGRYGWSTDAHTHDDGICITDPDAPYSAVYEINDSGMMVPCTNILHEYAHIVAPDEYHHHGTLCKTYYTILCDKFGLEAEEEIDRFSGDWGQGLT